MSNKRPPVDWEAIERAFRAGLLSLREIGRKHGVSDTAIRKRAAAQQWERDLTARVQEAVRSKAVRAAVRNSDARTEAEIVEEYGNIGAAVLDHQRTDIKAARKIVAQLLAEVGETSDQVREIEETIRADTANDESAARRSAMMKAVALPTRAATVRDLSQALRHLIGLERQAFNLDGDGRPASPLEGLSVHELAALERALADGAGEDAVGGSPASQS